MFTSNMARLLSRAATIACSGISGEYLVLLSIAASSKKTEHPRKSERLRRLADE